ncbi:MAG: aspartate--tRNA ligase [Dehalococcoidia bacterium]|jgi:aspartyl-tRNA synthetase
MYRTHGCGKLTAKNSGEKVTIAGWVHKWRDHGGLIFIDLRDGTGLVQVVFNPEVSAEAHAVATKLRNEYVLNVTGTVMKRPAGTDNPNLPTGEVEISVDKATLMNPAKTPPFDISSDGTDVDENVRLRYRYLDLRRTRMHDNIVLRHRVVKFMRDFLDERGFLEIETPIMIKSTPEGARDYLVPSRVQPGKFYALPQSPQQMKQLLMVAGFDKYFQIARCFRDEDLRADRQPEFTQLDLEMSFIDQEDILTLMEEMFVGIVENITPRYKMIKPFPRLTYRESMERFGSDKPDIRYGMEIKDISDIAARTEFGVFKSALDNGGIVRGICASGCGRYSRKQVDDLAEFIKTYGAKGLLNLPVGGEGAKAVVSKFLSEEQKAEMRRRFEANDGDMIFIVAGERPVVEQSLSALRSELAKRLNLLDPNMLAFSFIVDFPLFEKKKEGGWDSMHHPFTAPQDEHIPLLDSDPGKVLAKCYDLVCNGLELCSGSIRIHSSELQQKIFRILGYSDEETRKRFGHMLEAFEYGAPPHGGIAPGIDRFVMILAGESSIREVIAYPKNKSAVDVMFDAPSEVSDEQLKELHLRLRLD